MLLIPNSLHHQDSVEKPKLHLRINSFFILDFYYVKISLSKSVLQELSSSNFLPRSSFAFLSLNGKKIGDNKFTEVEIDAPIKSYGNINRCYHTLEDPDNCTTIAYGILGPSEPWIHSVMDYVAKTNNLQMDTDVKYIGEKNQKEFSEYLMENINQTQLGVIFCTGAWNLLDYATVPCHFSTETDKKLIMYNIVYNVSEYIRPPHGDDFRISHPKDPEATGLKISLDNAILAYFSIDKEAKGDREIDLFTEDNSLYPKITVEAQDFPKTHFRFLIGSDVINVFGCLQFAIPYMLNFLITSFEIVREKSKRLREGLSGMGMSATAYWFSWVITCLIINAMVTTSTVLSGRIFGFAYFTDTPFAIIFGMFFTLGLSFQTLAFWISTISANATIAYVFSYGVLLVSVILTLFINNIAACSLVFMNNAPSWFLPIRWLFQFAPAFNYSIIFLLIGYKSGNHFDNIKNYWVTGPGFTSDDLFIDFHEKITNLAEFNIPSVWKLTEGVLWNIFIYLLLTWYCDNVLAHNRGTSSSPFFFLQRQYWSRLAHEAKDKANVIHSPKIHSSTHNDFNYKDINVENSIEEERERVIKNQQLGAECKGLRIIGMNKIHRSSVFGFASKKDVHAVKDVYLEVDDGELLSLLGHNGAGKTTLMGVLTGLMKPTSGTAEMYNYDISEDMDSIRQFMGICPQFDILWDELTAQEHLQLFAKLKGIPEHRIPSEIDKRLRDVNLMPVKNAQAGTFSGGMKRRLSMAIAFIGDPKIVFLDEPTTGMDPKNRRYIWELIQKMKEGRVVILTTHAMEEADILSDRIAVISEGTLRCVGTGLYLKNRYGDGYRLSIVVSKEDVEDMSVEVLKIIPSGRILDCSGGSILVGVPIVKVEELKQFFKIMENKITTTEALQFKGRVKDWGLSNTTLEEVFMKITHTAKGE